MAKSSKYRFVGSHADNLASGRPLEPGEFVDLTEEQAQESYNAHLLDEGLLISVEPDKREANKE